ncbi:Inner membrane protein yedI [Kingella potus]|uniref:Inner membrane protein yedI n=1 Tax=Kingella potus TaxID=265175 RepID=A0A377R2Y8_9NEIS|nr:DUF808 domain-containing protein [Kingella potus]UOP00365.1 DUF808 domain-containing protein [Kingella potus]STR02574.1 Inner membrane protein yedI [Kingella potus]
MAFASLFTLLDDIASVLDDVALMTKTAAKKTVGVVGDDLALNAGQVTGVSAERELPVVWRVTKGSLKNKLILIPAALLVSALLPALVTPLLMIGGLFLCFEGVEKLLHKFLHRPAAGHSPHAVPDELANEDDKIKGAVRTDFILSAEIIIISLGTLAPEATLADRALVLTAIGLGMTVFVYGLVAVIVKLDDFGLFLARRGGILKSIGEGLVSAMPYLMRGLSAAGTLAVFLVGGGMIAHNAPVLADFLHQMHWHEGFAGSLASLLTGLASGAAACAVVLPLMKLFGKKH